MYSSSLRRTIVVVVLSLNISLVSCSCKIEQTKQTLNKTCEWSNWLPTLDCTSCGCNHTELLAFRKRAICCESNATLATCLKRCNFSSNDDTKYEPCSKEECVSSRSDTCSVLPIFATRKSSETSQTLMVKSPTKSELALTMFPSQRTFQFTPILSGIQSTFQIVQPSATTGFYSTLGIPKTESLLNTTVPSVTYSIKSLSSRFLHNDLASSQMATTVSHFESTPTFKGLNESLTTSVSITETSSKLESTKMYLSFSKSTLTQYEGQKSTSTSTVSLAEPVEASLMTRTLSTKNDVNATLSKYETSSPAEHGRLGTIIGAVCGTVAAFAIIAVLLILLVKKKQRSNVEPKADKDPSYEFEMQNDVEPVVTSK